MAKEVVREREVEEPKNTVVVDREGRSNTGVIIAVIILIIILLLVFFGGSIFGGGGSGGSGGGANVSAPRSSGY